VVKVENQRWGNGTIRREPLLIKVTVYEICGGILWS